MNLKDRSVLITGSSDGLGRAIALRLATEGTKLILLGRSAEKLAQVQKLCEDSGAKQVNTYAFDLSDRSSVTDQLEKIRESYPDLSVIINNAGIWQKKGDLDTLNHNEIHEVVEVNLTALLKVTNSLLPLLRKQAEAAVINVSSSSGVIPKEGQTIYGASKWGVHGFTENLKLDLKETKIRVAGIYQSGTATKMFEKAQDDRDLSEFTKPEDLADVVAFMLTRPEKIWLHDVRVTY